jgi:2-oxoglutarate dehydrogenase E2 component (dihydrolipoamide succinyltransferase)
MAIDMKVPSVGESVTEVTIASWTKKDGDFVKMDEVICELESDKATFELPAEADGILRILAKEGDTLPIGAIICKISPPAPDGGAKTELPAKAETPSQVEKPLKVETTTSVAPTTTLAPPSGRSDVSAGGAFVEVKIPTVGESVTEVTISSWAKKDGDTVKMDEVICELESDKATFELPSPVAGVLKIITEAGSTIPIGTVVATISPLIESSNRPDGGIKEGQPSKIEVPNETPPSGAGGHYAAGHPSPVAAKVLAEKGIDAASVQGTGVGGRIMKEDAIKAVGSQQSTVVSQSSVAVSIPVEVIPQVVLTSGRESRREKMSSLRKTIARRLVAVKQETAMLTTFNEVDMKPIMELRAKYKDKFKEIYGVGLGFMSFFTKACSIALKDFPAVNAYIDGDEIVFNDFADISIAVSAPRGLVVPVIRNAEKMNFAQIEAEVVRLAGKAKENKLTIEEMTGGTFTITNGGIFGSMLSTPIINAPQSAILGMHNIVERAVVVNGEIVVRPIMYVALSYDHRIIDGKDSVSFLVRVKQLLEDPTRILLGV